MSLTGLNEGDFTSINVLRSIGLGNRAGRGTNNQVIKSDGNNANWSDIASEDVIQAGTGISIDTATTPDTISTNVKSLTLSGTAVDSSPQTFNPNADGGTQTITINDTNDVYTGGTGINISGSNEISTNVKSLTLSGTAVDSSPQTFNPNADGGTQTITINDTNDVYTGGDGIAVSGSNEISADTDGTTTTNTGGSGSQISVLKVPNALTAGTNISFSTGSTYDGSTAITISSTDTNTEYTAGTGLSLSVGNEFSINLTEGTGITITGAEISLTSNTISGITLGNNLGQLRLTVRGSTSTYDGSSNVAINLDSNYTALRIPTSSSGLPSGALFNNSGTPTFVP